MTKAQYKLKIVELEERITVLRSNIIEDEPLPNEEKAYAFIPLNSSVIKALDG